MTDSIAFTRDMNLHLMSGGKPLHILRGITFAVDVESATEIADRFKSRGVPAAVIHGAMPDLERAKLRLLRAADDK